MRKVLSGIISVVLITGSIVPIFANEDYETNQQYYVELCSKPVSELTESEKQICTDFMQYISNQSESLQDKLDDLEEKRESIAQNIEEYTEKIQGYDARITTLGQEIKLINDDILVKEAEIQRKELEIEAKEVEVEKLREQVKNRMVTSQSSMRLNRYLDIIMGAKDLNDLVRRSNGLNDIANYDEKTRVSLQGLIEELGIEKEELVVIKEELEVAKIEVKAKYDDLVVLRTEANIVKQEYLRQEAEIEAEGATIAADAERLKELAQGLSENLNKIPNSSGFTRPIVGGRITAPTWYYQTGGVHLGADYGGVPIGTTIRSAGNGYVLKSVDGCPYGRLGSTCGSAQGGSTGGGNQVYLLTNVGGTLYAVKYVHLLAGSPIAQGSIVNAGDKIAEQGSSGNSSGPHVHVEIIKLGTMNINDYVQSWNGDLSFGAGWGAAALARTCDKTGAPCRIRPELVFE